MGGVTMKDVERIVEAIARAKVAESRDMYSVDWDLVKNIVRDCGLDFEFLDGAAESLKHDIEKKAASVRRLNSYFNKRGGK